MPNISNRIIKSSIVKTSSKLNSFDDVKRAIQDLEKIVNQLSESINKESETEVTDTDGKTGDVQATRNIDGTYSFEVKTIDGWKAPFLGDSPIKFKDKQASISKPQLKSIDEIEADDSSTGSSVANLTTFDEKSNKFILPRPDYDSGWTAVGTTALTHNLETTQFSMCQISHNDTADNSSHQVNNLNIGTVTTNGENAITVAFPGTQLNYYRIRLWK